ncbi:MAG: D-glycero-beta-D-manno-heptose 1-phosphate adenylyltransferase [Candidatus Aminicenantes bacterium]|jgi:D-beta-D-heptose 7-phosphate kinase/D-beta-D-heptose 1-phosphate adenosyltransferase
MPKICDLRELIPVRKTYKKENKKVVFTNGCFDILHRGHIHLFREAKKQGDVLIVAVNDDSSLRRIKGPARPIFPLEERMEVLAAIADIDYLVSFSEDTPRETISALLPDVLVKGGDWTPDEVVGKKEVEEFGGKVVLVPFLPHHSSTDIIQRIIRLSRGAE